MHQTEILLFIKISLAKINFPDNLLIIDISLSPSKKLFTTL